MADRVNNSVTVDEALQRLIEGIQRFLRGEARPEEGRMKFVGALYEIESGSVRFLT
jgi:hypothetical protein